jgi:nitroreductase
MLTTTDAVRARYSVRAFLDRPVDRAAIEEILDIARRAPSGGNLQPWRVDVLAGEALADLREQARAAFAAAPRGEGSEYPVYPPRLADPWDARRRAVGEQLYGALGIGREDRPARLRQFARNYDLFGAPVGLFFSIPRGFGLPQWAHLGMFIQSLMLLAVERGLGTCAQEAWAVLPKTVGAAIGLPDGWMLHCGMALGFPDEADPVNRWRSPREPVESFATFRGF